MSVSGFSDSILLTGLVANEALRELMANSVLIAGWVAMWRPAEIFLYSCKYDPPLIADDLRVATGSPTTAVFPAWANGSVCCEL